jgi:hypothetical protein
MVEGKRLSYFPYMWKVGQANSGSVANGLRKLLVGVNKATPLRLFTHSMGAGVATGALFNTSSNEKRENRISGALYLTTPTPGPWDIRLAMLAAARIPFAILIEGVISRISSQVIIK